MYPKQTMRSYVLDTAIAGDTKMYQFISDYTMNHSSKYFTPTLNFNAVVERAIMFAIKTAKDNDLDTVIIDLKRFKTILRVKRFDSNMRYSVLCCHSNVNVPLIKGCASNYSMNVIIELDGRHNENTFRGKWFKFWFSRL